jgi:hypothetical protein
MWSTPEGVAPLAQRLHPHLVVPAAAVQDRMVLEGLRAPILLAQAPAAAEVMVVRDFPLQQAEALAAQQAEAAVAPTPPAAPTVVAVPEDAVKSSLPTH